MFQHKLIVITGSTGVGKSALARALQEELLPDNWLHFSVDSIFYCLPHSIVLRVDKQNDRSAVDSRAIIDGTYACARTLLGLGHRIVFDAVILNKKGANEMLRAFEEFNPVFVELTCSWQEIERRTLARGDRTLAEAAHGYTSAVGHLPIHHTFDSTGAQPERIAKQLAMTLRNGPGEL